MSIASTNLLGPRSLETMRKQLLMMPSQQLLQYLYKPSPNDPPQWLIVSALKEQEDARRNAMGPPQAPSSTVAQQVAQAVASSPLPSPPRGGSDAGSLASMPPAPSPTPKQPPDQMQQPAPQPQPQIPPPGMAKGGQVCDCGVASLPYDDRYVGGGIVSFAEGKEVKKDEKKNEQLESARKYRESLETGGFKWGYDPRQQYEADADYARLEALARHAGQFGNQALGNIADVALAPFKLGASGVKRLMKDTSPEGMEYYKRTGKWRTREEGSPTDFMQFTSRALRQGPGEIRTASTEEDPRLTALKRAIPNPTPDQIIAVLGEAQPSSASSTEAPYYLSAPAVPPKYLRAPEDEAAPTGNIVEGELPKTSGLESVAGLLAGLQSGAQTSPSAGVPELSPVMFRDAGEELKPGDQRMAQIPESKPFKEKRLADEKEFGVDREAYMKRKEEAIAEQERDLASTKTRAWALPVLQASLELMGQSGSLGRGIGKVAPTLGSGLEKGYAQIEEQKGLLRKSKDAMAEAQYALAAKDFDAYQAKVTEAEQLRREQIAQNMTTNNNVMMLRHREEVDNIRNNLDNARADARLGAQLGVQVYEVERRIQSQMEVLQATLDNDLLVAALKAKDNSDLYKIATEYVGSPAAMKTIEDMRKRAPEKSDFEIQQDLIESMVDKMSAYRSGNLEMSRLSAIKANLPGFGGGRGTSGFSITPLPESQGGGRKFDLGLGSLTGQ